ncbi:MAG: hypothetical protein GX678_01570 [Actinomycetales bacterium]|nr:hypothetical protein [Actinomycetales bacterium]
MTAPKVWRLDLMPLVPASFALAAAWLALTPALLPRPAVFQGVVCAVAALIGYGIGSLVRWVAKELRLTVSQRNRTLAWRVFIGIAFLGTAYSLLQHVSWQNEMRQMLGMESLEFGHVSIAVLVGAALFVLFLFISRSLRAFGRFIGRKISALLPVRVAVVLGGLVAAVLTFALVDNVVLARLVNTVDASFYTINQEFTTDLPAPESVHLSAGPNSNVSWAKLGRQGRLFIAQAPTAKEIGEFSNTPAKQPVRAYVGVGTDGDIDLREEAKMAVAELERTGGFERAVINIATGTGRGWVNENSAQALEYMWNGDTATVSMQYSYLPSWASFLADGDRSQEAGRLLFDAVYHHWLQLPAKKRPLLVVSGESLGSFGGEAAFSGAQDLAERTSGALFVGPTGNNTLWSRFTSERDPGTPEIAPIFDDGKIVRFSRDGKTWPGGHDWMGTRIGYLQHDNDPITWWTSDLAFHKPDWLKEKRGEYVLDQVRWIPVITMLQTGVDQFVANDVPVGQGHLFGQAPVYGWATILAPEGWSDAKTEALAKVIAQRSKATADTPEDAVGSETGAP